MTLAGRVWNTLDSDDRMLLLRQCKTAMSESILQLESEMEWQKLWPLRQDELQELDFSGILGRDVTP